MFVESIELNNYRNFDSLKGGVSLSKYFLEIMHRGSRSLESIL